MAALDEDAAGAVAGERGRRSRRHPHPGFRAIGPVVVPDLAVEHEEFLASGQVAGGQRGIRQWLQHDAALAGRASAAYTVPEHFSLHHLPHLHELLPLDRFAMSFGPPVFEEETLAQMIGFLKGDAQGPSAVVDAGRGSGELKAVTMSREGLESYLASAPYRFRGEDLAALAEQQYAMVHDDALVLAAETRADTFADRLDEMMRQAEDYRAAD